MKHYAFYAALILYAALSNPTPDTLSWVEYCIAGLLIFSVGMVNSWNVLISRNLPFTLQYHRLFFGYMMTIPLVIGLINANMPSDIIRDIIPIAFLIIPIAFYNHSPHYLSTVLAIAGGIFSLRYCAPLIPQLSFLNTNDGLLYLANSPLVPFAAIMGFSWVSDPNRILLSKRILGLCIMIITFIAMITMLQRAPLILTALACIILLGLRSLHRPIHSLVIGAVIMAFLLPVLPIIIDLSQSMIDKTLSVGFNNRIEEFQSVMAQSSLLGNGWGALWKSPAVADIWVRFTHNMVSYYWLKVGAISAILSTLFILFWGREMTCVIRSNPALGLAIAIPLIIHVTLYTGFKTLDFACLLALCGAWKNHDPSSS
jgi:hypothetical protein